MTSHLQLRAKRVVYITPRDIVTHYVLYILVFPWGSTLVVVYRSRFMAVNTLHCRWYDSNVGRVPADVGEGHAGAAAVAVGSIATSEEAESPRFAGARHWD